jgi:hypothetical protein
MRGRVRLSFDVSEIKLVFSIQSHRPTPNFAPSWKRGADGPTPRGPLKGQLSPANGRSAGPDSVGGLWQHMALLAVIALLLVR